MNQICYLVYPQESTDILSTFVPQDWSRGICLTKDKDIARLLAASQDSYLYKCIINCDKVKDISANYSQQSNWTTLTNEVKKEGYPIIKMCDNYLFIPSLNQVANCIQYIVFNPDLVEVISCTPIKKTLKESLAVHSKLNDRLFTVDHQMIPEVRERLVEIGTTFAQDLCEQGIPLEVADYWLVGSNAAYNYQPDSDIDLHIIAKPIKEQINSNLLRLLYDYAKSSIMKNYDIKIKGQPVEIYIEDGGSSAVSNGVYSLLKDCWIKIPEPQEDAVLYPESTEEYKDLLQEYYALEDEDIPEFIDRLYLIRKESLAKEGEFGLGNLMFKEFRNSGRLQDLKDRMYKAESERLTLESLKEDQL